MKTFLIPRLVILTEVTAATALKAAKKFAGFHSQAPIG
jgi:hypothetical protein